MICSPYIRLTSELSAANRPERQTGMVFVPRAVRYLPFMTLVLTLSAVSLDRQSQRPLVPQPNNRTQKNATPDQRGTEESPLVVKRIPAQPTGQEVQEHQEDRELQRATNRAAIETNAA